MIYLYLFLTFFEIGLFGFGGGYGMLSLIQHETVEHWHWLSSSEFTDIVAISQMTPGPIGINSATYAGYTAVKNAGYSIPMAVLGSATATFALVLPSLILMILISKMFMKYMHTRTVTSIFTGLRPAVVGLLAAATLLLCTRENFSTPSENPWQFWISCFLFAATFIGTKYMKINPIRMILYCALAGLLLFWPTETQAQRQPKWETFVTDTPMVHDPVMAYEHGLYHIYATGHGIQHMTSPDRRTWTVHKAPAMRDIPQWTHDSVPGFKDHVWAPDVIRYNDKWWLAYSCSTFGKNGSAIGLLSADSLNGDWHDEGCIVCSREGRDNWNAIDPNFVIDDDGQPWLTWGSFWDGIQLIRLDATTLRPAKGEQPRTIARRYARGQEPQEDNPTSKFAGKNAIEAPFILKHNGWYYLFVSWDYCCRGPKSTYRVAVGRSRNVGGPYLDRNAQEMAYGGGTLVLEGDKQLYEAAGHCAAYHIQGEDIFICHGYNIQKNGASTLVQRAIHWTSDEWPMLE